MAANALAVVSLVEAKRQLQLPESDTSQDAFIQQCIETAVGTVQARTGDPILDESRLYLFSPSTSYERFTLRQRWVKSVEDGAYWLPTQRPSEIPGGVIAAASMQIDEGQIVPPTPNFVWPDRRANTPIRLTVTIGLEANRPEFQDIKAQCLAQVQVNYDGQVDERKQSALDNMAARTGAAYGFNSG